MGCLVKERSQNTALLVSLRLKAHALIVFVQTIYVSDHRSAVEIPDTMSFVEAAPLFCAGATMFKAIVTANLPKGSILGIVGLGALGHLGVQVRVCARSYHTLRS